MKTTAKHKTTGNLHEVEIYKSFVYFVNDLRLVKKSDFDEFFEII